MEQAPLLLWIVCMLLPMVLAIPLYWHAGRRPAPPPSLANRCVTIVFFIVQMLFQISLLIMTVSAIGKEGREDVWKWATIPFLLVAMFGIVLQMGVQVALLCWKRWQLLFGWCFCNPALTFIGVVIAMEMNAFPGPPEIVVCMLISCGPLAGLAVGWLLHVSAIRAAERAKRQSGSVPA